MTKTTAKTAKAKAAPVPAPELNETQAAEQESRQAEAQAKATIADVLNEDYDNEAKEGVACVLTLRDGRTLAGACAKSDDLSLFDAQRAAFLAALEAA